MIAVDTNVLARWLLKDEPLQSPRALAVMQAPVRSLRHSTRVDLHGALPVSDSSRR